MVEMVEYLAKNPQINMNGFHWAGIAKALGGCETESGDESNDSKRDSDDSDDDESNDKQWQQGKV